MEWSLHEKWLERKRAFRSSQMRKGIFRPSVVPRGAVRASVQDAVVPVAIADEALGAPAEAGGGSAAVWVPVEDEPARVVAGLRSEDGLAAQDELRAEPPAGVEGGFPAEPVAADGPASGEQADFAPAAGEPGAQWVEQPEPVGRGGLPG